MTDQIGPKKPPSFNEDTTEHLRQIADYVKAAGDRANATAPKDGSEATQMIAFDHLDFSMTQNEDDLDLDGYSVVRFDLDGAYDLTGILAGTGRWLMIINVSANTLTLKEQVTSAAANQLLLNNGGDLAVTQNDTVLLWYDATTARWRRISV
jgi:hypothetical protein